MAATALDIITQSLRKLNVYAPGETITDADAQQGLICLNDMIDSWSNESLACYTILEQTAVLQPGIGSYTIGPGGVWDMTRPLRLIDGPGAAYILDNNLNRYPVSVIPRDQWNLIGTENINADIPDTIFYDPQYPLGIINVFPIPNQSYSIFWDSYLQLVEFANLTAQISLPLGYKKAYQDSLAIELIPYFKDVDANFNLLIEIASKSKGNIKRTNIRPVEAVYDSEIISRASPTYNIYRDSGA
jgi:hypothetical protein